MCLVFCGDYIIPYIGSVLLFYFGFSIKKFGFLGVRSLSHSENIERQRQTAIQNGDIGLNGNKYILNVSVPFTSPSSAAMFVLGGSTNGWIEWKNEGGKTLDEMYRK